MYRIAICDDEKSTCAEIESYIQIILSISILFLVI